MKPHLRFYFLAAALLLAANALLSPAQAAPQKFVLDSSQSRLTLSGKAAGFVFTEQEAGSLTTSFSGNINLDLAEGTIQFTGASTIDARTNGVWQPGLGGGTGTAPADFGAKANIGLGTAYTAARNFILDVTSPTLTLTNGGFDSRALIFSFPTNAHSVLDYNAGFAGSGSKALAGYSTNAVVNGASLTTSASGQKLVIQIDTTYLSTLLSAQDSLLHVTGKLVANGPPPALVIDSIIVTGANVTLQVQNGSSAAQLLGSTNMVDWFPVTATASTTGAVTTLTAPAGGPLEFFRVQK